jgi:hypothetical protein
VLTTDQKGATAETAITHAAVELGIGVAKPIGDERYDLIFDLRPLLVRVQSKTAVRVGDVIAVRCYSTRRTATGFVKRGYSPVEIDAFAAYSPERCCYFLPLERFPSRTHIQLRLSPPRNNQRLGINWAAEFEFAATLGPQGAIAQLGERLDGIQKVAGSSPAGSIPVAGSTLWR